MADVVAQSQREPRCTLTLLGIASLVALARRRRIYGVISYVVESRTREIAVRMALGARPRCGGWFRGKPAWSWGGIAVGLAGAVALTRVEALLFEVSAVDPPTMIVAVAILRAWRDCKLGTREASLGPRPGRRSERLTAQLTNNADSERRQSRATPIPNDDANPERRQSRNDANPKRRQSWKTAPIPNGGQIPDGETAATTRWRERSAIQQRVQHLHDHHQQVVKRPIFLRTDALRTKVQSQVADRFRFAAGDLARWFRPRPFATERFTDIRADRLDRPPHLADVQQVPGW
jgi:hypothetical protein